MRPLLRTLAAATLFCTLASAAFASATITIINLDGPGEGFNDPTPAAPVGGNPGTTIGQQRLFCFQQAASIWGATLTSTVPIQIQAAFNPLSCTATSAVLGSAGPRFVEFGAAGLEFNNVWYHEALACKEAGVDLTPPGDPGLPPGDNGSDINAQFNSSIGNAGCLTGSGWYYGFDHNEGALIDLLAVLLHEFGHGLGFSTVTSGSSGNYLNGPPALPALWDKYLYDETTGLHWDQNTAPQRVASAINTGNLTWDGPALTTAAGTFLAHSPEMVVPYGSGIVQVNTAAFGAPLTLAGVTAQAVLAVDGTAPVNDACEPITNGAALAGNIAVIDRGVCTFVSKVKNAQNAGAIGVIIVNNAAGALAPGGVDPTITIPTVGITQADGTALKAAIAGGPTTVTLHLNPTLLAGAHPSGRVRMFAPNPFQGGSSVSHFDVSATPNLLMEPAINADLTGLDLTVDLFHDIGWFGRGGPVATQLALVAADVVNGHPHLEWYSADGANESMRLYRAALPDGFQRLGDLSANGTGIVSYDDMDALPGRSYEYQLGLQTPSGERLLGLAHIDVPMKGAQLAIQRLAGSSKGALAFSVVLAEDRPATLDVMDAAGRRIARQDLGGLGAGEHTVSLSGAPHSGVYWARVSQGGQTASTHFVLVQ
ncbi:MAG TPA: PA domain-containing protein [Gaiellales bacterium]|nr:PA domain-containing protein [Gaiellales bacterium]